MTPDQRRILHDHLLETLIAGPTRTPRSNVVSNAEKLADGDPDKHLGVGHDVAARRPGGAGDEGLEQVVVEDPALVWGHGSILRG